MSGLKINEKLLDSLILATREGLEMTGIDPTPVGATRMMSMKRDISVLISLVGKNNGTLGINLSRAAAAFLAARLLDEESTEPTDDSLDGICELGNMIAGRIKEILSPSEFAFDDISCPALIIGANYDLYHYKGMTSASVEYEIGELPMILLHDRFFTTSISLVRR